MLKNRRVLLCAVLALICIGVVMVYSSSFFLAERTSSFSNGYFFFNKHLTWVLISIVAMLLIKEVPYQFYSKISFIMLLVTAGLLIAVFIPGIGRYYYGAHRWIKIGPVGFQPSEFVKFGLIIFIAAFISKDPERLRDFKKGLLPLLIIIGVVLGLIMVEPDIGTTAFLVIIASILIFVGGAKLMHTVPIVASVVVLGAIAAFVFFPHVVDRCTTFLDPTADPAGKGYQINQALIGLGAGGFNGAGIGLSKQKLFYLPQQHTDFIMAIIGEEFGFIGIMFIMFLFFLIFWKGWQVFRKSTDNFAALLSLGITLIITLQALLNLAVVTASMPTKGMGMPFISYGGSAILATMCGVGILLNIAKQTEKKPAVSEKTAAA
jgi:cell division protein FtsW